MSSKDFPRPALMSSIPSITSRTNSLSRSRGRTLALDDSISEASIWPILGALKLSIFRLQRLNDQNRIFRLPSLLHVCFRRPPPIPRRGSLARSTRPPCVLAQPGGTVFRRQEYILNLILTILYNYASWLVEQTPPQIRRRSPGGGDGAYPAEICRYSPGGKAQIS